MHKPLVISECIGLKIGRLTVFKYDYKKGKHHYFLVRCECGVEKSIGWDNFKSGRQKTCGCIFREGFLGTEHPLYKTWCSMKQRCNNPNNQSYSRYGGRGVRVCTEWNNSFESFAKWSEENGWKPGLEIDKDKNKAEGGLLYGPSVCEWLTHAENMEYIRRAEYVWKEGVGRQHVVDEIDALEVQKSSLSSRKLAAVYGISRTTVLNIRKKKHGY